ncbi:PGF-CTERM sorting domain-containing protein [Halosimplex rubrum]|uniref:PGF-CTERM sorting domain-containing protein n=1 Tax=Halosimplex rubrum TaxID=869889 RepID=A0A7D5T8U6_9EURY|nr:PGF-CTERM sorting domain-containing protein [Halosimplex rubrum]
MGVLALALVVGAAGLALAAPNALAERTDENVRPSVLSLQDPRVAAGEVGGERAELSLDVRMEHRGGPADNVTVEIQAVDTDTGLVATTVRKDLGTIDGNREVRTRVNVTVDRQGGYRLYIRVYEDGRRVETGSTEVSGVDSLTPDYADTSVGFHRFGDSPTSIPVITYDIAEEADNRTTLRTGTYLTNRGDESAGGLRLVVVARQVESNVIADRATVEIDEIGPGQTVTEAADLTVPSNYNYYLDGMLFRDGVVVESATASAKLDPSRPVPENTTREEVDFRAGDFERGDGGGAGATPMPTDAGASGPGFGGAGALAALLALAALATRRNNE